MKILRRKRSKESSGCGGEKNKWVGEGGGRRHREEGEAGGGREIGASSQLPK